MRALVGMSDERAHPRSILGLDEAEKIDVRVEAAARQIKDERGGLVEIVDEAMLVHGEHAVGGIFDEVLKAPHRFEALRDFAALDIQTHALMGDALEEAGVAYRDGGGAGDGLADAQ